jgi:hypothetical protein
MKRQHGWALLLVLPVTAMAAPTVQPGLWESTQTMNGEQSVERDCVTPAEAADTQRFRQDIPQDCTLSKVTDNARTLAFDYVCEKSTRGSGRFELQVPSPTQFQMRYRFKGETKVGAKTVPVALDLDAKSRWIAADCGDLAEDDDE